MSLVTFLFGTLCFIAGMPFFVSPQKFKKYAFTFLRSKSAAYVTFGLALAWFVYIIMNLGEADFGNIKNILLVIFGGAGVLAFYFLPDFLSVRGLAGLILLSMRFVLDTAFMQEPEARKIMVAIAYMFIVSSIYIGCLPYRLRDFFEYIFEDGKFFRARIFGITLILFSIAMYISILTY